jgi:hypothetical protein
MTRVVTLLSKGVVRLQVFCCRQRKKGISTFWQIALAFTSNQRKTSILFSCVTCPECLQARHKSMVYTKNL